MRVSWRSHWQLRGIFCPFEAFYEMLKKNMSLQIISVGTPVVGGALPDISGRPTCHPLFETHTLQSELEKLFSIIVWRTKIFHAPACIHLPGIILCVWKLHHIWKPGQESSDLKCVLFFFSVIVWRKSSTPEPISNFRASHSVYQNCTTFENLDNIQVCT